MLQLMYSAIQLGLKYPRMTIADLRRALPPRTQIMTRVKAVAENGVNLLSQKIRHAIDVSGKFAATTDMWTEPNSSTPTIALTLHYFTIGEGRIKLEADTADLREIKAPSMTATVIKRAIYDMLGDYGISEEEARDHMCVVTDRDANMLAAVTEFDSEVCAAHLFNNVNGYMLDVHHNSYGT